MFCEVSWWHNQLMLYMHCRLSDGSSPAPNGLFLSSTASIQLNIYICILSVYKRKEKQKMSLKKLLDILFSIFMENNIFNSFFTEIFVRNFRSKNFYEKMIKYIFFHLYGK